MLDLGCSAGSPLAAVAAAVVVAVVVVAAVVVVVVAAVVVVVVAAVVAAAACCSGCCMLLSSAQPHYCLDIANRFAVASCATHASPSRIVPCPHLPCHYTFASFLVTPPTTSSPAPLPPPPGCSWGSLA